MSEPDAVPSTMEEALDAITRAEEGVRRARANLLLFVITEERGNRSAAARRLKRSYKQITRDIRSLGIAVRLVELERELKWPAWGWGRQE